MPETFFILVFTAICLIISIGIWVFLMWLNAKDNSRNHIAIWDKLISLEIQNDDIMVKLNYFKERFTALEKDVLSNYADIQEVRRRLGM